MKNFSIFLTAIILLVCQTVPEALVSQKALLYDQGFEGFENVSIESQKGIFELNDEAKAFAKSSIKGLFKPEEQIQALVQHVFSRSNLHLLYLAETNTVASETFQNRAANCLSCQL